MRIWIELTNSPHINMFGAMIHELEKEHEVIITCRPLANTIELPPVSDYLSGNFFKLI